MNIKCVRHPRGASPRLPHLLLCIAQLPFQAYLTPRDLWETQLEAYHWVLCLLHHRREGEPDPGKERDHLLLQAGQSTFVYQIYVFCLVTNLNFLRKSFLLLRKKFEIQALVCIFSEKHFSLSQKGIRFVSDSKVIYTVVGSRVWLQRRDTRNCTNVVAFLSNQDKDVSSPVS